MIQIPLEGLGPSPSLYKAYVEPNEALQTGPYWPTCFLNYDKDCLTLDELTLDVISQGHRKSYGHEVCHQTYEQEDQEAPLLLSHHLG